MIGGQLTGFVGGAIGDPSGVVFGSQERWWTAAQRADYRAVLGGHDVAGILVGHSHAAFHYPWEGLQGHYELIAPFYSGPASLAD